MSTYAVAARNVGIAGVLVGAVCMGVVQAGADDLPHLTASLRPVILNALPKPLYEKSENWGNTATGIEKIRWRHLRPEVVRTPQNDGHWRKTRVTAIDPDKSLEFRLGDLKAEGADRLTLKAYLALMMRVEREDEIWEKGLRLLRETVEARVRVMANMDIEASFRLEVKTIVPDAVVRAHVTKADVRYDNLVVENIGGIGGTGARWLGESIRSTLKQWKPSMERELLARANAAIVKAADTKEVRLSLSNLLNQQNGK